MARAAPNLSLQHELCLRRWRAQAAQHAWHPMEGQVLSPQSQLPGRRCIPFQALPEGDNAAMEAGRLLPTAVAARTSICAATRGWMKWQIAHAPFIALFTCMTCSDTVQNHSGSPMPEALHSLHQFHTFYRSWRSFLLSDSPLQLLDGAKSPQSCTRLSISAAACSQANFNSKKPASRTSAVQVYATKQCFLNSRCLLVCRWFSCKVFIN